MVNKRNFMVCRILFYLKLIFNQDNIFQVEAIARVLLEEKILTFQNNIKRVGFVTHPNHENPYGNFFSLIFPGGKLSKIEENMKISKCCK